MNESIFTGLFLTLVYGILVMAGLYILALIISSFNKKITIIAMEIKLNAGDKITIPANCKATIEDNLIIIEKQKEEFKSGDILHSTQTDRILIFKNYSLEDNEKFSCYYNNLDLDNFNWAVSAFRHTTKEEKQEFFDELKAKGLLWNEEIKAMEKIRKRAKIGEFYLYIGRDGEVFETKEGATSFDDKNYNSGNYYLPEEREQAEEDAKAIKAIFEKRLKVKL